MKESGPHLHELFFSQSLAGTGKHNVRKRETKWQKQGNTRDN